MLTLVPHFECLSLYGLTFLMLLNLLFRVLGPGMQFQHKLHIVYLVNDILHHCQRKGAQDLQKTLEDIIVPLFFCTQIGESPENLQKVTKVLGIWENHNLFEPSLLQASLNLWYSFHVREIHYFDGLVCTRDHVKALSSFSTGICESYKASNYYFSLKGHVSN